MALPSQNARPISRRAHMHRRRRHRRTRSVGIGVGVLVLLLAAWWVVAAMFGGEEPAAATGLVTGVGAVAEPDADRGKPAPKIATPAPKQARSSEPTRKPATKQATPPLATRAPAPAPVKTYEPAPIERPREQPVALAAPDRSRDAARAPAAADAAPSSSRSARRMATGLDLLARDQPIDGRRVLSDALSAGDLSERDARVIRERLAQLNHRLVFSPEVVEGDPFTLAYVVKSGDLLSRVPRRMGLLVDWRFIQLINRINDPKRVRVGQRLKLVTGPFHAVVHKSDYRLDLYLGDGPDRVYVRSFPVGLGEYNSTPEGRFRVRENSKLIDPEWINPRTRERFAASDPSNPIGEHWIGLEADDERVAGVEGYGIHGTIEPDSIGRQASMGCVRMLPDDVAIVWAVMTEGISTVEITR